MSAAPPRITCLYFSEVTVAAFLKTAAGQALAGDLLIECSSRPALSCVLNVDLPPNYRGVAGLLGGIDLDSLAHSSDRLPAPVVFAPTLPIAATATRAALALLHRPDERINAVTLLVPIADARALGAALAIADRHAIAWDATVAPHEELLEFTRWLAAEKLLTAANFAGLYPYASQPLASGHAQRLAAMLGPLAAQKIHSAVTLVA